MVVIQLRPYRFRQSTTAGRACLGKIPHLLALLGTITLPPFSPVIFWNPEGGVGSAPSVAVGAMTELQLMEVWTTVVV